MGLVTMPLAVLALLTWYHTGGAIFFGDVDWYATGMRSLISSGPLYDPAKLLPHPLERPPFWDQAPSTSLLTLILLLPYGGWLWGFLMFGSAAVGLALILPRVGPGGIVLLGPILLVWPPVTALLAWANVNALVFLLLVIAWRWPRHAGVSIGLAAAIKLVPILAVAWLVGKRDWRNTVLAIGIPLLATAIVVAWKGPTTILDFITLRFNQWTPADPTRWGLTDVLGLPNLVAYAIGLCLALMAWRWRSFSLSIVAMLASSPALHLTYWTWLLIPFFGAWMPFALHPRAASARSRRLVAQIRAIPGSWAR